MYWSGIQMVGLDYSDCDYTLSVYLKVNSLVGTSSMGGDKNGTKSQGTFLHGE